MAALLQNQQQVAVANQHHQKLQQIWASLCYAPRIENLQKVFDCLSDTGPQRHRLIMMFDAALGYYPEPVMSVCIFLLFEAGRKRAAEVKQFFQSMWNVLGQLIRDKPNLFLHSRRQHGREVTIFYDHMYGLYVVRKLALCPITFADILVIADILTQQDAVSRTFRDWAQSSIVVANWSAAPGFAQLVVWIVCSKILIHGQPTAHPLITLMLEVEKWSVEQYIKAILVQHGVDGDFVHYPFGNAISVARETSLRSNPMYHEDNIESPEADESNAAFEDQLEVEGAEDSGRWLLLERYPAGKGISNGSTDHVTNGIGIKRKNWMIVVEI